MEEKVLQLEGERAEKNLEMIRIRANMDRVERATKSVMRGWQLVGSGLAAMTAIDELQVAEPSKRAELEANEILRGDVIQVKQSSRIVLDPHALPGGVARSVSRAPEMQLTNLEEEDSRELKDADSEAGLETVEADDTAMLDEDTTHDARQYSNERTVVMDGQEDVTARRDNEDCWNMDEGVASSSDERQASTSNAPSSSTMQTVAPDPSILHQTIGRNEPCRLKRATSTDSFSSFGDDEEVQLSDDLDEDEDEDLLRSILQDQKEAAIQDNKPAKSRRKRGLTLSPDRSEASRSVSPQVATFSSSEGDYLPSTRSSRRSSARDRKSINYALPKLNTKMRKPDPADLIPAQGGEVRRHDDDEHSLEEDSNRDSTPKRILKGGSEVASTGNLREIRKQHQSIRIEDEVVAKELSQNGRNAALTRRRSSNTPAPRKSNSREASRISDGGKVEAEESWTNGNSTIPISWKSNGSNGINSIISKSAATGTPIPRNQSGQNIKALKVANRIQKTSVSQPTFSIDGRKANGRPVVNRPTATFLAGGTGSGNKVLTSSLKQNQAKSPTTSIEAKRSSLLADMTWEEQDCKNHSGQS